MFAGVYRAGKYGHALSVGVEWQDFLARRLEFHKGGLRLVDVASYSEGGKQLFAGVFCAGGDLSAFKRGSWHDFISDWQQLSKGGLFGSLRLVSVDSFVEGQEE